jgi:chromosome segregation ATPase
MVDQEVEDALREIRERVLAESAREPPGEHLTAQPSGAAAVAAGSAQASHANGRASGDALAHLQANLSTTERAWSRLPPLVSYRSGLAARIELWLKSQIKRAAHWFTWEQVNFNSAVHHALGDTREALAAYEQRLAAHEQALTRTQADIAALRDSFEQLRAGADAERARVSDLHARLSDLRARVSDLHARVEQLRAEQQAFAEALRTDRRALAEGLRDEQRALAEGLRDDQRARAAEILGEMRERAERLLEEQRVCFKQLSLETGEAAVRTDRARRQIEARLEALEEAVNRES